MPIGSTSASTSPLIGPAKRKRDSEEGTPEPVPIETSLSTPHKRQYLRIEIPSPSNVVVINDAIHIYDEHCGSPISGLSEPNSLFDEPTVASYPTTKASSLRPPALLTAPLIQGLYFTPTIRLSEDIAESVTRYCLDTYFQVDGVNQIMLFGRFYEPQEKPVSPLEQSSVPTSSTGLPPVLLQLLSTLDTMLFPFLPPSTHSLLFPRTPTRARQAILNLYQPGEGISPHVDLLKRFDDGIIGVSLGSGCVMQFSKAETHKHPPGGPKERDTWDVYLPERSVIVLSEDARYKWTHSIDKLEEDYVAVQDNDIGGSTGRWIARGVRLSITFRWLLPGADIVGDCE